MRVNRRYVFSLVLISCLVNTLLAFFGQQELRIHLIINLIIFLVLTLTFTPSIPRTNKIYTILNVIFFAGFLIIVGAELTAIISGK